MSYEEWEPKLTGKNTRIEALDLKASKSDVDLDDTIDFTLSFKVLGDLRDVMEQEEWENAYNSGDSYIRLTYEIEINKRSVGVLKKHIIKPRKFVRKITFYWSRNPDLPYRIWALVVKEDFDPIVPKNTNEAKSLALDVKKTYRVLASDLGKGHHKLSAKVKIKWAKHSFIQKGKTIKTSPRIQVICK